MNYMVIMDLMTKAFIESQNSPCKKKKVGAIIADKDEYNIWSRGHGEPSIYCKECVRKKYTWQQDGCWAIHSEVNALFNYFRDYEYRMIENAMCLVTHGPCDQCIKYLEKFGITTIIYAIPYHNDYSKWSNRVDIYEIDAKGEKVIKIN